MQMREDGKKVSSTHTLIAVVIQLSTFHPEKKNLKHIKKRSSIIKTALKT